MVQWYNTNKEIQEITDKMCARAHLTAALKPCFCSSKINPIIKVNNKRHLFSCAKYLVTKTHRSCMQRRQMAHINLVLKQIQ